MNIVLIRPTTGARRATRRTALAAALLLASSTLAVSVTQQADAVGPPPCTTAFPPIAPVLVNGAYEIRTEANLVFLSDVGDVSSAPDISATDWASGPKWRDQDFVQKADLDLAGCLFIPIGKGSGGGSNYFSGSYDGGGFSLSALLIDEPFAFVGLFSGANDATLSDIRLVSPVVKGGDDYVGALAGEIVGTTIVGNVIVTDGRVEAVDSVGGLIGYIAGGQVRNAHFFGVVSSTRSGYAGTGGLVGLNQGVITDSSASGSVTAVGNYVGGLVGDEFGEITNSWATGDVQGANQVGGLVGGSGVSPVAASYATGKVTGTNEVGGLVGKLFSNGTITDSFATGEVTGTDRVGGLVGFNEGTVANTFSTGLVAGSSNDGGLIGEQSGGTIEASFWDLTTSGLVASAGGAGVEGKPTAEMTSFATFAAAWNTAPTVIVAGWQAPSNPTWGICAGVNGGYPFLLWQFDTDPCSTTVTTPTTAASTPVLIGGAVPEVPAGQGVWQQADGTSTPLAVASTAANQLRYEAEGVRVTLTGTAASSPARGLVVDPAGEIACEVCVAASAGQVIEVWMFSTPRLVAAHRVDDTECHLLAIPLSAPLDGQGAVSAGAHTLQLAIPTSSGMQAINVGVTVGGLVPASVPAGEGPMPMPLGLLLAALVSLGGAVLVGRRAPVIG